MKYGHDCFVLVFVMFFVKKLGMNIDTGIITDDFTGAGDSSIFFCQAGYAVYLPLNLEKVAMPQERGILVINTESRLADEEQAYRTVSEVVEKCRELEGCSFYKK